MDKTAIDELERLILQAEPLRVGERVYTYKNVNMIHEPVQDFLKCHSIDGLLEYIRRNKDKKNIDDLMIQVLDYKRVFLFDKLNVDLVRPMLVKAEYDPVKEFNFDSFIPHEEFVIGLLTQFFYEENDPIFNTFYNAIRKISSTENFEVEDKIFSSSLSADQQLKINGEIKTVIELRPFRTFSEVKPVFSKFIFRAKKGPNDRGILCALFECDGGAWIRETRKAVKNYIEKNLGVLKEQIFILD